MRLYTNQEQTEILERLKFPESDSRKEDAPNINPSTNYAYSVGELFSFLDNIPTPGKIDIVRKAKGWEITIGNDAWAVYAAELVDALFMACLRLKEFELL